MPLGSRQDYGSSGHTPSETELTRLRVEDEARRRGALGSPHGRIWLLAVVLVIVALLIAHFALHLL